MVSLNDSGSRPSGAAVSDLLAQQQIVAYAYVALAVAALYDHVTTLDLEIEHVWRRPSFTIVQLLFLINRYFGDALLVYCAIAVVVNSSVVRPDQVSAGGLLSGLGKSGGSLVDPKYLLLAFFAIEIAATVPMQAISGGTHPGVPISIPGVQLCEPRVYERWYYLFWLPILVFEFLMLGLSIFKALQYRATTYHAEKILYELSGRQSLKFILLRDSIVFPFLAFCGCLLNLIGWRVFSSTATQINLGIAGFGARIFGCQLVLSLREAYYRPFDEECSQVRPKLPSIIFVHTSRESMEEGSIV